MVVIEPLEAAAGFEFGLGAFAAGVGLRGGA